ncbi:MAG: hypothetical protein QXX36_03290 [Candidatus Rehaiarchaeum fermentans]|nr:hypothetical protein [Candidatus Rehaiarchaeum fermentans]MCW1293164.1 hypothetical protein [Candidatus Rehaiarchaeum fermentans]MCW1293676.1 hypothetical protein [Candidatus Rehaiarchaeum fermentans]MCW1297339.1 hypothetical protein [Candidatus Rehaiarchaeum fermentans]MCW1302624.1 hypothetical protein [Candidatus Rehaiarchaeum fermentans]
MRINGIIIDTNEIVYAIKNKIDIYQLFLSSDFPLKFFTTSENIKELKKFGIDINPLKVKIIPAKGKTDEEIIRIAKEKNLLIFTEDKELALKAKKLGLKAVKLKNKKSIEFY